MRVGLVFALCLLACACARPSAPPTTPADEHGDSYEIDGRRVSEAAFHDFERSLKGRKDLVLCGETSTGGMSSYEATSPSGIVYEVTLVSDSGRARDRAQRQLR